LCGYSAIIMLLLRYYYVNIMSLPCCVSVCVVCSHYYIITLLFRYHYAIIMLLLCYYYISIALLLC